jgi:DNA-binding GntR family transcriptional regulator
MPQSGRDGQAEPFLSKSQWAYRTVRAMILSGELEPGTSLDQQALAAQIGLSTTPLREALRRLEAEDYVISRDHREMLIAPMSLEYVEQIYVVRLELDPLAARLACENMTTAQVRTVQALLPPESGRSKMEYLTENREFHRAIYSASGNVALTKVLEGLYDQSDRYRAQVLRDPQMARRSRDEHAQMCDLLIERNAEGLAALMRAHLLGSLEHYRRDSADAGGQAETAAKPTPIRRRAKATVS